MLQSWRPSTARQYKIYIKRWISFCEQHGESSTTTCVNKILDFLTHLYHENLSFSAIGTAKSTIASFVTCTDEKNLHDNGDLKRFMKGICNLRPPRPKYGITWDVDTVLKFLKTLFPLDKLSLKELTLKSVCLAALVSGQRAQSLHEMDLETSVRTDGTSISYIIKTLTKETRPGIKTTPICIHQYAPEPALCAYATITKYIEVTSKLCKTSKLWISFVRPNQEVGRQTISRWLKTTLAMSGIEISIFTAHSTRMASTSKAAAMGVGLQTILKTAGWHGAQNFKKFYHREAMPAEKEFFEGVLSSSTSL